MKVTTKKQVTAVKVEFTAEEWQTLMDICEAARVHLDRNTPYDASQTFSIGRTMPWSAEYVQEMSILLQRLFDVLDDE